MLAALAALLCEDSDSGRAWQEDAAIFPLTSAPWLGNSELPQNLARRIRRLCLSPRLAKRADFLVSCHHCTLWPTWAYWDCGYILAEQRPGVRETPAALRGPGSVVLPFFVPNPKPRRCIMLRFLLSSRFLRLRYRLNSLAERLASILTLAAVFFMAFVGVMA